MVNIEHMDFIDELPLSSNFSKRPYNIDTGYISKVHLPDGRLDKLKVFPLAVLISTTSAIRKLKISS